MSNNALWWIHYTDKKRPEFGKQMLSLSSPDLVNARKAHARARKTARARLRKKGVQPIILLSRCVG